MSPIEYSIIFGGVLECRPCRAEEGLGFLRMGHRAPSPPARDMGEHCELPSGVRSEAPAETEFGTF